MTTPHFFAWSKPVKIGVFDSGIGGLSVTKAIEHALPELEVVFVKDSENVPYGNKSPELLLQLVEPILRNLIEQGCMILVIACNTATTLLISQLRERLSVPLIGLEPMIRPAAQQTKSGVIAVCATPGTLSSVRYHWLKQTYAPHCQFLEPDCSSWASMIEHNSVNEALIAETVQQVCQQGADVIVLGCTHYHWIERTICQLVPPQTIVLQPEQAIIARLRNLLASGEYF